MNKNTNYRERTTYLGVRVDNELKTKIEQLAEAEGRSVSNWVQRALQIELARRESDSVE